VTDGGFKAFIESNLPTADVALALSNSAVVCHAAPGNAVIFVSPNFTKHTGYAFEDVLGRNLSMLQGPDSEPDAIERFRSLIAEGQAGTVLITNYRKDGSSFVHKVEMRPIRNAKDELTHFVAVQQPCES
jgi:PAS domain S-box-containing protein